MTNEEWAEAQVEKHCEAETWEYATDAAEKEMQRQDEAYAESENLRYGTAAEAFYEEALPDIKEKLYAQFLEQAQQAEENAAA